MSHTETKYAETMGRNKEEQRISYVMEKHRRNQSISHQNAPRTSLEKGSHT